jgi:Activator of Hsp90 ATPase homolog 1-like protein
MIHQSVVLALPAAAAFALFTRRISECWPPENRHTQDAGSTLHLLESGRFFERSRDGREVELGRVLVWEEARRIVLDFYVATGPDHPTHAEVRFDAVDGGTRVTVRHGPKPPGADRWAEQAPRYERAWRRVLAALALAADA